MQRRAPYRRGLVAMLATALLMGAAATASAGTPHRPARAAESDRRPPPVPVLGWTDCGDGFQCATAEVPLDYRRPRRGTIELALIRRPAIDQANRIGSLFLNPGGPGGSGVEFVRTAPPVAFQALARFDWVGFDPRGVGASQPAVDCGSDDTPAALTFDRPQTVDPAVLEAEGRAYGLACLERHRELLPHLSTANVARDVDLLRAAVGDERLNYIGISYGSVIGATYATLFPGRARAMVLDSPLDVEAYYNRPIEYRREQASGFENAIDRFFTACAAAGDACGFGGTDPEAAFDSLVDRLDRNPLPSTDPAHPFPLNGDEVRLAALSTMYSTFYWPAFASALVQAEAGDPSAMIAYLANDAGIGDDVTGAVWAVDQDFPRGPVGLYVDAGRHAYGLFDHFWWLSGYPELYRALWPVEDRAALRGQVENPADAAPILVVGVTYDPATPYIGAERLTADLGNARLFTYHGDGHGALTSLDPCLLGPVFEYLNDGVLPPDGASCIDPNVPFPSVTARSTEAPAAEPWGIDERRLAIH